MKDKKIGGSEMLVWLALAAESFVIGSNVIKAGHTWIAKASKLSRPTATLALNNLITQGYVDVLVCAKPGRSGVYMLTPAHFASAEVILSNKEGTRVASREEIEGLRKRLRINAPAKAAI